jgi:hypothetical protein
MMMVRAMPSGAIQCEVRGISTSSFWTFSALRRFLATSVSPVTGFTADRCGRADDGDGRRTQDDADEDEDRVGQAAASTPIEEPFRFRQWPPRHPQNKRSMRVPETQIFQGSTGLLRGGGPLTARG